jgi:hypothetical protein
MACGFAERWATKQISDPGSALSVTGRKLCNRIEKVCEERNRGRKDRDFGPHVIRQQKSQLRRSIRGLKREGFSHVFIFDTPEEVEAATIERTPLWNDKRDDHGPFDILGDLHGCCDELEALLQKLGYTPVQLDGDPAWGTQSYRHPEGRKAVFLGDLVDRGPRILDTLRLVRNMVAESTRVLKRTFNGSSLRAWRFVGAPFWRPTKRTSSSRLISRPRRLRR